MQSALIGQLSRLRDRNDRPVKVVRDRLRCIRRIMKNGTRPRERVRAPSAARTHHCFF